MNINLTVLLTWVSIAIMLFALFRVVTLKREMPGGMVGKNWNYLMGLVILFAGGYVAMPFLGELSKELLQLAVAGIFLFGAVYVVITINLIMNVIKVLSE
jgi:hypothetical protein